MELTQERLDEIGLTANNVHFEARSSWAGNFIRRDAWRKTIVDALEAATGEKVTIVEPEPEIPYAVIEVFAKTLCLCRTSGKWLNGACSIHLAESRRLIVDLWKVAKWGGLRK